MDFSKDELAMVEDYWINISQDADFISQETGINKKRIVDILVELSEKSRIEDFDLDEFQDVPRVHKFTEMKNSSSFRTFNPKQALKNKLDVDDYFDLDLDKMSREKGDKDYFFDFARIHRSWTEYPLSIYVIDKRLLVLDGSEKIIGFNIRVRLTNKIGKSEFFRLMMFYQRNGFVSFSRNVEGITSNKLLDLEEFYSIIVEKQRLFNLTSRVLDELVPDDLWDVLDRQN